MRKANEERTKFRTAALGKNLSAGTDSVKEAVATALGGISENSASAALVTISAEAAIAGLTLAYNSFEAHREAGKNAHDLFVQDYHAGTVSCFLPDIEREREDYQKFFAHFLQLFQEGEQGNDSPLMRRAGISYATNVDKLVPNTFMGKTTYHGTSFSLISAAQLVFAGIYENARKEDLILDTARNGSDLLLRAKLRSCLKTIFSYKSMNPLEYEVSRTLKPSILHRLDLLRFMILVFANLLINAQHPAELSPAPDTPLSAQQAKELCAEIKSKIDVILLYDRGDAKSPWAYLNTMHEREMFFDFLALIKREVEELEEGYQSKILNQLDLNELIAQSQGVLQELNELWHQIIYSGKPGTETVCLLYLVRALSNALDDRTDFWSRLPSIYQEARVVMPTVSGLQKPYGTVMDLLGLFFYSNIADREKILEAMKPDFPSIRRCLNNINKDFIFSLPGTAQAKPAQAFLMNLIALSTESFPPFIQEPQRESGQSTLQQQFAYLNTLQISQPNAQSSAFTWSILENFADKPENTDTKATPTKRTPSKKEKRSLSQETLQHIKGLIQAECQFLDTLRIVYAFQGLLESNKNLLLHKNVVGMVKKVLGTLERKTNSLMRDMQQLYNQVNMRDKINTDEKDEDSNLRRHCILDVLSDKKAMLRVKHTKELIDAAIEMVDSVEFSRSVERDLTNQVESIYYASHEEFVAEKEQLLSILKLPMTMSRQESMPIRRVSETNEIKSIATDSKDTQTDPVGNEAAIVTPVVAQEPTSAPNQNLRLLFILRIMRAVSAFLLIAGLLILLSLAYAAPYAAIITALTAQQMTLGTVVGGLSTVVGGVGLALSVFFKPRAEVVADPSALNTNTL